MEITDTVKAFMIAKQANGRAPRTLADYQRVLKPFVEWCNKQEIILPENLDRNVIRRYVAALRERDWAEGTVAIHIRNLRTFLRWLHDEEYTERNLAKAIQAPRQVVRQEQPPTLEEIRQLLEACIDDPLALRDRALILMLASTGLRRGEIPDLTLDDLHLEEGWLRVYTPKTNRYRFAFLTPEAQDALRTYLESREDNDACLFHSSRYSGPLGYDGIYAVIRRRAEAANLDPSRVHPHSFRKFLATYWVDKGGDEQRLMRVMDWSSPKMLQTYVRLGRRRDLLRAHKQFAPRLFEE